MPGIRTLCPVLMVALLTGCFSEDSSPQEVDHIRNPVKQDKVEQPAPVQYEIKSISSDNGWGFEIYSGGALFIRQTHIPAVQGIHAFQSEAEALSVAALMVSKMKHHIMPPSVTKDELDSLGIVLTR